MFGKRLTLVKSLVALLGAMASCGDSGTTGNTPTCTDGVKNGSETDVDCGSACGTLCAAGKACLSAMDCAAPLLCQSGVCVAPSCMDQVKNQDETDVDCGGATCAKCGPGGSCSVNSDCATGACDSGKCAVAATFVSMTPSCGSPAGGTAVTLTGTNFVNKPGLGVRFGQTQATGPTVTAATTITAMSPMVTMPGKVDVSIDGQPGGTLTLPMSFNYVADPAPASITWGTEQSTGFAAANALALGDFNADKLVDFIQDHSGGHLDMGLGMAAGTLGSGQTSIATVGAGPTRRMITADLNGDGKADVIGSQGATNISVYLSLGATIGTRVDYVANTTPEGLVAGDFNGDGKQDIATIHSGADFISVLIGNGDGTLKTKVDYAAPRGTRIAAGDLDGDGKLDLVATSAATKEVSVLIGNGDGTFKAKVGYPTAAVTSGLVLGDFDADGKLDVVTGSGANLSFLANKGDGTLLAAVDTAVPASATLPVILATDFDGNGTLDIILLNPMSTRSEIWLNPCSGKFVNANKTITIPGPVDLAMADLNGDKKMDLVYTGTNGVRYVFRQ